MFLPASALRWLNYDIEGEDDDGEAKKQNIETPNDEKVDENQEDEKGEREDELEDENEREEALFDPPLYKQRYYAVAEIINQHSAKFVIDMGCSEGQFLTKVKESCPLVERIAGIDVDVDTLERNSYRLKPLTIEYILKREVPLTIGLYCGSISRPDSDFIGADVIACIEVIEHLYQDTLDEVPHALFGVLKPKVVVITTPNCEYNVLFPNFTGMRHWDHKFEWNRREFESWCASVVSEYPYDMEISGVGEPPLENKEVGYCSQMCVFTRRSEAEGGGVTTNRTAEAKGTGTEEGSNVVASKYKLISEVVYPHDDLANNRSQRILNETEYIINHFFSDVSEETEDTFVREIPVKELLAFPGLKKFELSHEDFFELVGSKYTLSEDQTNLVVTMKLSDFMRDSYFSDSSNDDHYDLDGEILSEDLEYAETVSESEFWD